MSRPFVRGLHEVGDDLYAYLQPDGGWGQSNAGLVVDGDATLLLRGERYQTSGGRKRLTRAARPSAR